MYGVCMSAVLDFDGRREPEFLGLLPLFVAGGLNARSTGG